MIRGNIKSRLSKTDVARYINDRNGVFPELDPLRSKYNEQYDHSHRQGHAQFGYWVRAKKPVLFQRIFKWAVKNTKKVLKEIYP